MMLMKMIVMKIMSEIKRCHTCYWYSYDWFDDGDEFEVCKKGNEMGQICKDYLNFDDGDNDES